jgi:hypothetical protein
MCHITAKISEVQIIFITSVEYLNYQIKYFKRVDISI